MYEKTVAVAQFNTPGEAHVALARLEAEGIAGVVVNDVPNAASSTLLGQLPYAPIQLAVAESQVERALKVLGRAEPQELEEGWEDAAEGAIEGWICAVCDTPVPEEEGVCPECATPRGQGRDSEDEDDF